MDKLVREWTVRGGVSIAVAAATLAGCGLRGSPADQPAAEPDVELGYTADPEATTTATTSTVDRDEIRRNTAIHVIDLIRGLPGVVITSRGDGGHSVRIRGSSSILGNNEPLVVIHGRPITAASFTEAVEGIHPQDVQRVDVLRDPGSLAMYGSRGANGVIVITMRRAR